MRTTVTLDADTEQLLRERMARRGVSFKQALNDSIRDGNPRPGRVDRPATTVRSLGRPAVNLDRALHVVAEMEDEELTRRLQLGQ